MLSRRSFLLGVSTSALIAGPAGAGLHMRGNPNFLNAGMAWLNSFTATDLPFANQIKNIDTIAAGSGAFPTYTKPTGYPIDGASVPVSISNNLNLDQTYYGHYGLEWSGQGSWQLSPQFIVYNGGAFVNGLSGNTGSGAFNLTIVGKSNPFVEFAYGFLAVAVSTNGGLVQFKAFVGANIFGNVATGAQYKFNNLSGLPSGPNADGSWTITKIDNDTITLQGSSAYAGLVSITSAGGPGVQTEGILSVPQDTWGFFFNGPYSGMGNMLWYKMANQALVRANPNAFNPDYISKMTALRPYGNRFMDASKTNNSNFVDHTQRFPTNAFALLSFRWNNDPVTGYWAGQSSGTDTYTCSNPPASGTGAYQQGETVQLQWVNANTGYAPTLQLGSRAAAPLFDPSIPVQKLFRVTGTVLAGDSFSLQFTASYLSGGVQTVTVTGQTTGVGVASALAAGIVANANLLANNVNGGYDGIVNLGEIQYAIGAGSLTITPSTTSAGATLNIGTLAPGTISANLLSTCVYDTALGGFMMYKTGLQCGVPVELQAALCNQLGCHYWANIPHVMSATSAQAMGATVRASLNANLKCYVEPSNEVWNNIFTQSAYAGMKGTSWGIPAASARSTYAFYAYISATLLPAFSTGFGGGPNLYKVMALQQYLGTSVATNEQYRFEGADLIPSALYPGPNFSTVGNRPCDIALDTVAWANYISGAQIANFDGNYNNFLTFGGPSTYTSGDAPTFDGLLGAADAYFNNVGNGQSNALDFVDWDLRGGLQARSGQTVAASNSGGSLLLTGPPFANGRKILFGFTAGGSVPDAITAGKTYFVVGASGATFKVSLTLGGSAISYGTTNGTNVIYGILGDQTLEFQNTVQNPAVSAIPTKYGKTTDLYEGAMEAHPPSTNECSNLGISTLYSAKISALFNAWKNDLRFKQYVIDMVAGLQALSPPARENWYQLTAGSQWSLSSGSNINGPFFKSFDGLAQINN